MKAPLFRYGTRSCGYLALGERQRVALPQNASAEPTAPAPAFNGVRGSDIQSIVPRPPAPAEQLVEAELGWNGAAPARRLQVLGFMIVPDLAPRAWSDIDPRGRDAIARELARRPGLMDSLRQV